MNKTIGFALIHIFVLSFRLCFFCSLGRRLPVSLTQFFLSFSFTFTYHGTGGWVGGRWRTGIFHCQPRLERERNSRMTCFYSSSFILLRSITKSNLNSKYLPCTKQINLFPLDLSHET